jgi:hypothetical protein
MIDLGINSFEAENYRYDPVSGGDKYGVGLPFDSTFMIQ